MILAPRLLGLPIRTAEMNPRLAQEDLLPGEERAVTRAVASRRREFCAGRGCARKAMAALGARAAPILQGEDRAPVWPDGLVGSITHTDAWCAAAVARTSDGIRALGLDVEPAEPIDPALLRIICLPQERALAARDSLLGRLLFSAKESAYKAQYQLSRTLLGFHAMQVLLDEQAQRFVAVFQKDVAPFSRGDALEGRYVVHQGFLMTAVTISR
jgi:4'-phosphopantetheinyl transferase EntD